jgi:drug/metabolite transporter (DMT)-like permease
MKFGVLVAATAGLAWGYVYATKDNLMQSMNPLSLLAGFYLTGALLLVPAALYNRADMVSGVLGNPWEFFTAVFGILVAEACIIWSISLLGGTEAGLVEVSYPLWTALFAYLVYNKVPTTGTLVGGALVMAGIAVLSLSKPSVPEANVGESAAQE